MAQVSTEPVLLTRKVFSQSERLKAPPACLRRYESIVDDADSFYKSIMTPLPLSVWVNTARLSRKQLTNIFVDAGLQTTLHHWNDIGLRVEGFKNPGHGLSYMYGQYHIQEEVSMFPVLAADLSKVRHVLDMCAAPGNKTLLTAMLQSDRGSILANDRSEGRMQVLKRSASRLGFASISMTSQNAGALRVERSDFDLVLADVPCSCEGTARKNKGIFFLPEVYKNSQVSTQRFILKKAADFCRKGSRIIYSTCTFAPEENEENVQWFLKKMDGRFKVVPTKTLDGFRISPGITEWNDQSFDHSLADTVRIWPHHNDTGGFYVATLEAEF